MDIHDDIKYHSERAMIELDLALAAADASAAKAHLDLSSLHLKEMRALAGPAAARISLAH